MAKRSSRRNFRSRRPRSRKNTTPITTVKFTETISDVIIGGGEDVQALLLFSNNLPWLRETSSNFSQFEWKRLQVTFVPAGSMTYVGQVCGGFTYDQYENPPSTFAQVNQLSAHRVQSIHKQTTWTLDVKRFGKRVYPVVNGTQLLALDPGDRIPYLPAIFWLGVKSANTQLLGTLIVSYSVALSNPLFLEAGQSNVEAMPAVRQLGVIGELHSNSLIKSNEGEEHDDGSV